MVRVFNALDIIIINCALFPLIARDALCQSTFAIMLGLYPTVRMLRCMLYIATWYTSITTDKNMKTAQGVKNSHSGKTWPHAIQAKKTAGSAVIEISTTSYKGLTQYK